METRSTDPVRLAREHLDATLDRTTDDTTRYHIRTALRIAEALLEEG